jgi:hypothetical protein
MKGRVFIEDLGSHVGEEVTIGAWVDVRRDQGKLVFGYARYDGQSTDCRIAESC